MNPVRSQCTGFYPSIKFIMNWSVFPFIRNLYKLTYLLGTIKNLLITLEILEW